MLIISDILLIFLLSYVCWIIKKIYGNFINPLSIFLIIWSLILFNIMSLFDFNDLALIYFILVFISFILPTVIFLKKFKSNKAIIPILYLDNQLKKIERILVISVLAMILQLLFDSYIILQLGGNIINIFGDVQSLRFMYLARNSDIIQDVIFNILNYFKELGVILSAVYVINTKKYKYVYLSLIFSFFHSIATMSKLAFFIDVLFIFSILSYYNIDKKKILKMVIILGTLAIFLIITISNQRGYIQQESQISQIDNVVLSKSISYFGGPTLAFFTLLNENINHSYGIMTFTPFLKLFFDIQNDIGIVDIGFFDTNVYTLFGSLYIDFGYIGSIFMIFLFSILLNYIFYKMKTKNSLAVLSIFCILNTALYLSFFDWIGRQSFFWLFPFFAYIIDGFFIKRGWRIKWN